MNGPEPALSDQALVAYARRAGFSGMNLLTMVATILGESGGDPDNVGDESLANDKWGPSIGLAQVRSLWADKGTGRTRDPDRLTDPAFNLRSAWQISSGGTSFKDWSVFTSGAYKKYLDRAAGAINGTAGALGGGVLDVVTGAGGVAAKVAGPFIEGLGRIVVVGLALAGGVALVAAGGWRAVKA